MIQEGKKISFPLRFIGIGKEQEDKSESGKNHMKNIY